MDNSLYTAKANIKLHGHQVDLFPELTLEELLDHDFVEVKYLKALCSHFHVILDSSSLRILIEGIFHLESVLLKLKDKNPTNEIIEDLSDFYKSLSPILLRIIWEQSSAEVDSGTLLDGLVASLRVALEEELFYWHERLKSVDNRS